MLERVGWEVGKIQHSSIFLPRAKPREILAAPLNSEISLARPATQSRTWQMRFSVPTRFIVLWVEHVFRGDKARGNWSV
jgi:hypothetical protein